ncbi:MAG TPA: YggS family pyridoxal phosphate enzyme [Solirubrobacteraceae bacterium]|nr:YggS family pyridoxal phosphate enzyme [Solirubrobacteraceae bacterium]
MTGLRAETVRANVERVRGEIASTGRAVGEVQILAAVKYVPVGELGVLAEAGIDLVGENRAQDLVAKAEAYPGVFTWDFIGHLQSRKVRQVLPHVRYIETVASDSVLAQLGRHAPPETEVLVEINVAREEGKSGLDPDELPAFLERCPVTVVGLMTMPPLALDAEDSRPHFAALRELAQAHGLPELSMGTSQDYLVAVQEGATIVRLGTSLYA